jgi:hypothetical protein
MTLPPKRVLTERNKNLQKVEKLEVEDKCGECLMSRPCLGRRGRHTHRCGRWMLVHTAILVFAIAATEHVCALDHKTLIDERRAALITPVNNKTKQQVFSHLRKTLRRSVPVPIGVRNAWRVGRNLLRAHSTRFGKQTHVAVDAVRAI